MKPGGMGGTILGESKVARTLDSYPKSIPSPIQIETLIMPIKYRHLWDGDRRF